MTTRFPRSLAAALALAAAFAIAACGGDDGDSESEETIALSEWVSQADEVCAETNAAFEAEGQAFVEDQGVDEETVDELVSEVMVPHYEDQLAQLRDLPAPDEDADRIEEMLAAVEEGTQQIEDDPSLILEQEPPPGFATADEIADEVGLKECGA